ncbi:MAG: polysaccharide pyruvyl transferase family protein [Oscillospiraceae bacterium]|nr:polysaccharide pyruvyl transferase family protein [Oscillospiraceae bacterium]
MKIGILTYHATHNYGAYLQAFALASKLRELKIGDVDIINYNTWASEKMQLKNLKFNLKQQSALFYNCKRYQMFKSQQKKLPLSKKSLISDSVDKFAEFVGNTYDLIIVGSDEVWVLDGFRGFPNAYWLPNIEGVIKASYAASSRNFISDVSVEKQVMVRDFLSSFDYIGVRDVASQNLISEIMRHDELINLNCDPTFLYDFKPDKEKGKKILNQCLRVNPQKKVVGLMCGEPMIANKLIEKYSSEYEIVSLYNYFSGTYGKTAFTPFEWIDVIASLDGLVTTFFHGMVFAIKSNIPFVVIEGRDIKDPIQSKNYDLLSRNSLASHYIQMNMYSIDDIINNRVGAFLQDISSGIKEDFSSVICNEKKLADSFTEWLSSVCEQRGGVVL